MLCEKTSEFTLNDVGEPESAKFVAGTSVAINAPADDLGEIERTIQASRETSK